MSFRKWRRPIGAFSDVTPEIIEDIRLHADLPDMPSTTNDDHDPRYLRVEGNDVASNTLTGAIDLAGHSLLSVSSIELSNNGYVSFLLDNLNFTGIKTFGNSLPILNVEGILSFSGANGSLRVRDVILNANVGTPDNGTMAWNSVTQKMIIHNGTTFKECQFT